MDENRAEDGISTHAPLQGATKRALLCFRWTADFYSRTLAGCDSQLASCCCDIRISTHAPLQGATILHRSDAFTMQISTHAPLQGATIRVPSLYRGTSISTHAPLQGATLPFLTVTVTAADFYSRTLAGCDPVYPFRLLTNYWNFYSRTLAGCDYDQAIRAERQGNFYSRTLAGCDSGLTASGATILSFLLTHPCRVRLKTEKKLSIQQAISTHAPLQGATQMPHFAPYLERFLLTHPCRVRRTIYLHRSMYFIISTHAPLQGATTTCPFWRTTCSHFYSRTLAGCDLA